MIDLIRSGHRLPGQPTGSLTLLSYHPWFRHGAQPTARMQTDKSGLASVPSVVYNPGPVTSIRQTNKQACPGAPPEHARTHARITLLSGATAAVPATRARAYTWERSPPPQRRRRSRRRPRC
ncbi:hypothetical protein CFC21_104023 [Triticum aestivum]|uniref:Uncharacterized protein n=2 Tax=Triticum aestivum TaxID=4565 RepID=A0A3B6SJ63_WHEAT|nr:hypothetical protein CFC21_104023 [Triticum aestivum]